MVACPFCGKSGFDLVDLKIHLSTYCYTKIGVCISCRQPCEQRDDRIATHSKNRDPNNPCMNLQPKWY